MLARGYDVEVITHSNANSVSGEKVIRTLALNPQNTKNMLFRVCKEFVFLVCAVAILILRNRKRTIILTCPPFSLSVIPILFSRKFTAVILDVRDLYPDVYFDNGLVSEGSIAGKILRRFESQAYDRATSIITVTESLREKISGRTSNKSMSVVHNGFDQLFMRTDNVSMAASDADFIVVCHGNFGRFQNVDFLISLAENCLLRIPGAKFKFIGFGSKFEYLKTIAPDNCLVIDAVSQVEIIEHLKSAQMCISARTDDSTGRSAMPVKVLECLGFGMPVVSLPLLQDMNVFEGECNFFQFNYELSPSNVTEFFSKFVNGEVQLKQQSSSDFLQRFQRARLAKVFCDVADKS